MELFELEGDVETVVMFLFDDEDDDDVSLFKHLNLFCRLK